MALIVCIDEALIEILPVEEKGRTVGFRLHRGGSLLNVAAAAARLGSDVALVSWPGWPGAASRRGWRWRTSPSASSERGFAAALNWTRAGADAPDQSSVEAFLNQSESRAPWGGSQRRAP